MNLMKNKLLEERIKEFEQTIAKLKNDHDEELALKDKELEDFSAKWKAEREIEIHKMKEDYRNQMFEIHDECTNKI